MTQNQYPFCRDKTIRSLTALAPLTNLQSNADGTLGDDELRWLTRRASGGFGIVFTCAAYVSDEGKAWHGQLGVASDAHLEGLTRLAVALKAEGALSIVQLHHGGDKAELATPVKLGTVDADGVRGATAEDLVRVTSDFVAAAKRAEQAGFDGVEIHGANGYLFTQFLAPDDNQRADAYGGDLQGRARFLRETVKAVREAVSPAFIVGVRLSPVDTWARRGLVLEDAIQTGKWITEDGADFIHLSLRDAAGTPPFEPEVTDPIVTAFRAALPTARILAAGDIWTAEDLNAVQTAGADVGVIGRAGIGNPDWPTEMTSSNYEPVRPPWTETHLRSVNVGEAFLAYLNKMSGLVVGGKPPH